MTGTTDLTTDYNELLTEAIDLREDGDYEDSLEKFKELFEKFPNDARVAWEYANTLMKLNRPHDADDILGQAAKGNPHDFHINKAWTLHAAFVADSMKDHMNAIRRGRAFRNTFPPQIYPEAWQSLTIEIDLLWEIGLFDNLEFVLDEHWDVFVTHPEMLPVGIHYYAKLFLNNKVKALLEQSKPQAWEKLPPESQNNLILRTELALQVHDLVEATGTRVFGIGQNCLPYLVGGPWGLKGSRAHVSDLTFMDRAMFYNDTAAETIENDFSEFRDRQNFEFVKGFGRCYMPRHIQTGATFFHDRASFFENQKDSHFYDSLSRRIDNWRNGRVLGTRKLYLFCFCGAGSLENLVEVAKRHLLDEDSNFLIIDVLKSSSAYPVHPRVSYIHAPYPPDFIWDGIFCYSTKEGFQWEMTFIEKIISLLKKQLTTEAASIFEIKQKDAFRRALDRSRQKNDIASLESILSVYMKCFEPDESLTLEYVSILRTRLGNNAANDFFIDNPVVFFENKELLLLSVEVAAHSAHWDEAIDRVKYLCAAFPPQSENLAWPAVNLSLVSQYESGLWSEAHEYILRYWGGFTEQPELFITALDFFSKVPFLESNISLIQASSDIRKQVTFSHIIESVESRLGLATENQLKIQRSGVKIIPLGQNTMASILLGRWGLCNTRKDFKTVIPFDICDFINESLLSAIETNFEPFLDAEQYRTIPVAVGGEIIEHAASGASFFLARRAHWNEDHLNEFHNHLAVTVQNWRMIAGDETKIYYHIISRDIDLDRLISAAQNHLLIGDAYLVIIDTRPAPETFTNTDQLIYLHAPMPAGYDYYHLSHSSTPEGTAYELEILRPVFAILENIQDRTGSRT